MARPNETNMQRPTFMMVMARLHCSGLLQFIEVLEKEKGVRGWMDGIVLSTSLSLSVSRGLLGVFWLLGRLGLGVWVWGLEAACKFSSEFLLLLRCSRGEKHPCISGSGLDRVYGSGLVS